MRYLFSIPFTFDCNVKCDAAVLDVVEDGLHLIVQACQRPTQAHAVARKTVYIGLSEIHGNGDHTDHSHGVQSNVIKY